MDAQYLDLMIGLFEIMLRDYLVPTKIRGDYCRRRSATNASEAEAWFFADTPENDNYVLSFKSICQALGWDHEYMRQGIRLAKYRSITGGKVELRNIWAAEE